MTRPADWLRGDWLQTFTGRAFYPFDPRPEDIDEADIAHGLSLLCRYAGQCSRFYSVAEHSVLIARNVSPDVALWGLLHDASEAYLVDLPRPVKRQMPQYVVAERRVMAAICERFGLPVEEPVEVKAADTRILRDERLALMGPPPLDWTSSEDVQSLGVPIEGWAPDRAEQEFLFLMGGLWEG